MSGTGSKPGRGRKPKAPLSPDEQALWDHAARTMKPLRKAKARVLARAGEVDEFAAAVADVVPKRRVKVDKGFVGAGGGVPDPVAAVKERKAVVPPLADFDRKSAKRLRGGQLEIGGRIDLHGMRQDEAHGALRRFLLAAQARGERWVLVITGKGAPRRDGAGGEEAEFARPEPGVLRRNVPRWLGEPELRAIVVSHTEAAIHHGGTGALYVQLRKR